MIPLNLKRSSIFFFLMVLCMSFVNADSIVLPKYPILAGDISSAPNLLVLYDNSISMDRADGNDGNNPNTNSNKARNALRDLVIRYKDKFNWGLEAFQMRNNNAAIAAYYKASGDSSTIKFVSTCGYWSWDGRDYYGWYYDAGLSRWLRCVVNPDSNSPSDDVTVYVNSSMNSGYVASAGHQFFANDFLLSANKRFKMIFQADGNLVIYDLGDSNRAIWASNTMNSGAFTAVMQADGNFVLYDINRRAVWSTGTWTSNAKTLIMQDNGNLVLYRSDRVAVWATGTNINYVARPALPYVTINGGWGGVLIGRSGRASIDHAWGMPPVPVYTYCASENGYCSFSGTKKIAYGADGTFAFQTATGGISCDNNVFGDPAWGVSKSCYIVTQDLGSENVFMYHNPNVTTWNLANNSSITFDALNDFKDSFYGWNPVTYCSYSGSDNGGGGGGGTCGGYTTAERSFIRRKAWWFERGYTGAGQILLQIPSFYSDASFNSMLDLLRPEKEDANSTEIKNGSNETPLVGSFKTAKDYFSGVLSGFPSPIQDKCQQNYIILATDGKPTVDINGNYYSSSDLADPVNGKAYTDLYTMIDSLRGISFNSVNYDIKTYVLGMGDVLNDSSGVNGLNKMAVHGGTDNAYLSRNQQEIANSFQSIVDSINSNIPLRRSNGHVAVSNQADLSKTSIYIASFANPIGNFWQGNVMKNTPYVSASGGTVNYDNESLGDGFNIGAAALLQSASGRQIIAGLRSTSSASVKGYAFSWNNLSSNEKVMFYYSINSESSSDGMNRINYLRGDRSLENTSYNYCASENGWCGFSGTQTIAYGANGQFFFRSAADGISCDNTVFGDPAVGVGKRCYVVSRSSNGFRGRGVTVLGDIVDSSPLYIGEATSGFSDSDFSPNTPSYKEFSQKAIARKPMVYVGANDGMLHGFDAGTLKEVFAFIPNAVLSKLAALTDKNYTHDFYVNESPIAAEVLHPARGWTTQLIGFMGAGGKGVFALDVTSPDGVINPSVNLSTAESNATNIVMWEINGQDDPDIGYIFNKGQIDHSRSGKTRQIGVMYNGRPAIMVGNGYNSTNDSTGLFVIYLDGNSPLYEKKMVAGVAAGLSAPTPVDIDYDGKIDYVYAGDLKGNVWKFDVRSGVASSTVTKIFQALDANNKVLPITTAPEIISGCYKDKLLIIVGTGKFIEFLDNKPSYADGHEDYLFGLLDDGSGVINKENLVEQTYLSVADAASAFSSIVQKNILSSDNAVVYDGTTNKGWMIKLRNIDKPARIVVPPYASRGILYFNTISPNAVTCAANQSWGTSQALQVCSGARPKNSVFDINYDGSANSQDQVNYNGGNISVSGVSLADLGRVVDTSVWISPKALTCKTPPCPEVTTSLSDFIGVAQNFLPSSRMTWREIINPN